MMYWDGSMGAWGYILMVVSFILFWGAIIAAIVVFVELWAIAFIQNRYMETPFLRAVFQVVLGGSLVLAAGILIGNG